MAADKFSEPGVYVFKLKENEGSYEGVTYNASDYYLLVNVQNNEAGTALEVVGVNLAKANGTKVTEIYNNYGGENLPDPNPDKPEQPDVPKEDKVYDLTVKKHISGIGANTGAEFKFTFKVNTTVGSADSAYIVEDAQGSQTVITPNTAAEFNFTQDKTYKIYGLSANDTVTVTEEKAGEDGYTTSYTLSEKATGNVKAANDGKFYLGGDTKGTTVTLSGNDQMITVDNDKSSITVTGVAMNIAPYAAMVLGAGAFAGIFLGMKKKDEE